MAKKRERFILCTGHVDQTLRNVLCYQNRFYICTTESKIKTKITEDEDIFVLYYIYNVYTRYYKYKTGA